jgi:hypothetical protein
MFGLVARLFGSGARSAGRAGNIGREGALSRAASGFWALSQAEDLLNRNSPLASNFVTVTIVGLPNANLNNLYMAALSIASGVLSYKPSGSTQFVEGFSFNQAKTAQSKIGYMSKTVTVMIGYSQQGWIQGYAPQGAAFAGATMFARPINDPVMFFNYPSFLQKGFNSKGPVIPAVSTDPTTELAIAITSQPGITAGLPTGGYNGSGAFGPGSAEPAPIIGTCSVPPTAGTDGNYTTVSNLQLLAVVRRLFM